MTTKTYALNAVEAALVRVAASRRDRALEQAQDDIRRAHAEHREALRPLLEQLGVDPMAVDIRWVPHGHGLRLDVTVPDGD